MLSAYPSLLIFLRAILIPACVSSSPAFLMMYSAYKLNKQSDNIQLDELLFLFGTSLLFHTSSNCCFLTGIQISQEADQVVWYSHLFQNFSQFIVIHTVNGFGIVNKVEIDVFLELSCFFRDPDAAAAAKSLQSCLTLCDPIVGIPPGSPFPGFPQARTLEWFAISFSTTSLPSGNQ